MSIILAIDPGYDRCGVAFVQKKSGTDTILHSTCITTNKTDAHEVRLAFIFQTLTKLIAQWQPTHLAIETLFFSVNKKTAIRVAEARGMILTLAGIHHLELIELSPQAVKIGMTGSGNADKQSVQKMVGLTLGITLADKIDDEIDAIAVGISALQEVSLKNRI